MGHVGIGIECSLVDQHYRPPGGLWFRLYLYRDRLLDLVPAVPLLVLVDHYRPLLGDFMGIRCRLTHLCTDMDTYTHNLFHVHTCLHKRVDTQPARSS